MRRSLAVAAFVAALAATQAWAVNSVVVESKTIGVGATGIPIHIKLANDVPLGAVQVPLVIREVLPGAFITSLRLSFGDRLPYPGGPLSGLVPITKIYAEPDGTCRPGGFRTVSSSDTLPHPVAASPEGLLFVRLRLSEDNDLPAGADATGSFIMTVGISMTPGTFEIDTTCIYPDNHLVITSSPEFSDITPSFTKGTVTISPSIPPIAVCHDVTASSGPNCDAMVSVDNGSYDPDGQPVTIVQEPAGPYLLGETHVRLIIADIGGFADTCEATVTVIAGSAHRPVARCRDVAVGYAMNSQAFASIDNGSYDPDGDPITLTQIPPGPYPLGQTPVRLIVSDGTCGIDTCQATVTVAPGICNGAPADVNCDGVANVFDIIAAVNAIFNNGSVQPCCVGEK